MSLRQRDPAPRLEEGYRHRIAVPIIAAMTIPATEAIAEVLLGNPA
jgi:hypothetical protein